MGEEHIFSRAKWIYADCTVCDDQYTEYLDFLPRMAGKTLLYLSADSNYAVKINGCAVASGQYGDFEHYKIYDVLDVSDYLSEAQNRVEILLYYCGAATQRYRRGVAGLLYEFCNGGQVLAYSGTHILSRLSPTYQSGVCRCLTPQLGFTFSYDATTDGDGGYKYAVAVDKSVTLFARPIKKQRVLARVDAVSLKRLSPTLWQVDLGRETVGFPSFCLTSPVPQALTVSWGESLTNGRVRAVIGRRHFSFDYRAREGKNLFAEYMLRISCRYLEITSEVPIDLAYLSVLPEIYEVADLPYAMDLPLDGAIYKICLNTLHLCMMEHYVDTPWREQCLYSFDSRNQMLCGYFALKEGNAAYARANLQLMSEDRRDDGLLSICAPSGTTLAIPSFSLYYILAMHEYAMHTGDWSLARTYAFQMEAILDAFLARADADGLIQSFAGKMYWNFYDWSPYLAGKLFQDDVARPDLVINCLFVLALDSFHAICNGAGLPFRYEGIVKNMRAQIRHTFWSAQGALALYGGGEEYTVLGNALAICGGVLQGEEAVAVADLIVSGSLTPASLSMNIFKYEALLQVDAKKYRAYILEEIRRNYQTMLDAGATTVWETLQGADDFDGAGSLCHGWSAVPIYIYHKLGLVRHGALPSEERGELL